MSSDARLHQDDQGLWTGNHDGACTGHLNDARAHAVPEMLGDKIEEIEMCTGRLFWLIDEHEGAEKRLRGWRAR